MDIPEFLAHLDRDSKGRPVPYINAWGDPSIQGRTDLREDPNADGMLAVYYADTKAEGPNFFQQNPQRQRECFNVGLCQVCARPVDVGDRFLINSSKTTEFAVIEGVTRFATLEPWVDAECVQFATTYCPGLLRLGEHGEVVPAPLPGQYTEFFQWGTEPGHRDRPVVFYRKITLDGT